MEHWIEMGVDGLRLDAVPYLCEREGTNNENLPETHAVIREIRANLDARYPDRMLLAEANQWPEDVLPYFGNGDECHMAFHFPLMPRIYMALAQEDRHPITDIMRQTPDVPDGCQWAIFLRNHDELTLEMVSDRERDYLWRTYATDARARLNLGIRRRLAPLLQNDHRKIQLLNSLLMSMPGTPILYYGDEIGMGDNIYLGDRDGVRTPMQWSPDRNAGFSRADPARLFLPPIMDPVFGYEAVNVEAQNRSPSSLLNWLKGLIAARKSTRAFGRGTLAFLRPGNRKVLAYLRQDENDTVLCLANLSRAPQPVELDLAEFNGRVPVELLGRSAFPPVGQLPYFVTLPAYGFYWFLLAEEAKAPSWHETIAPTTAELVTLVIPQGWASLTTGSAGKSLQERSLPDYLTPRRWFAAKGDRAQSMSLSPLAEFPVDGANALLATVSVSLEQRRQPQTYGLPLMIAWEELSDDGPHPPDSATVARVRRGAKSGVLFDATADDSFVRALVAAIRDNRTIAATEGGEVAFTATSAFPPEVDLAALPVARGTSEQSNTSVRIGEDLSLKVYRLLQQGVHPEVEIGHHLTEVANFANTPPLFGSIVHRDRAGAPTALAVLSRYVVNQGDGFTTTLDYLRRFLEEADLLTTDAVGDMAERHRGFVDRMTTLGRRTAELHRAFAVPTTDSAFKPAPTTERDLKRWRSAARDQANKAFALLRRVRSSLSPDDKDRARQVLRARAAVLARINAAVPDRLDAVKTRYHGDMHLGQVLVVHDDFIFVDFEGEPARPLAERRVKHSPLRDVAGMLRSFHYVEATAMRERLAIRAEAAKALAPMAEDWRRRAHEGFMAGYLAAIGDCPSVPTDAALRDKLIFLFLIEKALYEIGYEGANRPDWIGIPMEGVLALLALPEGTA